MADVLQLQVSAQDPLIKLSWSALDRQGGFMAPFGVYCISQMRLRSAAKAVRAELKSIAEEYLTSNGSYEQLFAPLATAGELLKDAVFPRDDPDAQGVLAYVAARSVGSSLYITTDATVQVPWSFVFLGDPVDLPAPTGTIADFAEFLCLRFKIRLRYSLINSPPLTRPIRRESVKTLLALHEERFATVKRLLADPRYAKPEHGDTLEKMNRLLEHDVGWTVDWADCRAKWKRIGRSDSVFYIFAHSDGRTLSLKEGFKKQDKLKYHLQAGGFESWFGKQKDDSSQTLCFINGCRTVDGELDDGFLSVTSAHGFQGFIGSEAEISSVWATRYAAEFLYRLVEEGKSVDEAYEELRELCFPMSLWYSCYAHPQFRVVAE
jgi:hypothetical protein